MAPSKNPSTRLFIGGLPYRFTEGELLSLFAPYGRIVSLKIMHTPWGKSRGIGFVEFDSLQDSVAAKQKLHNHSVAEDRTIIVDFAEPDPMTTEVGRQRHVEAARRRPNKFPSDNHSDSAPSRPKKVFGKKPQASHSSRQSVFDSRTHHSRVGAKFARRRSTR